MVTQVLRKINKEKIISKKAGVRILHAESFRALPWLVHGVSTSTGGFARAYGKGDLNLGFTKDDSKAAVERNRVAFLQKLGATFSGGKKNGRGEFWPLVTLRQVHSDVIHYVDAPPAEPLTGDGLITNT